jgi:hypothetical protein
LQIDESYLTGLKFIYVKEMSEVIGHALLKTKVDNARMI